MSNGIFILLYNVAKSLISVASPVDVPVSITPSDKKNSAAFAVSRSGTSAVME